MLKNKLKFSNNCIGFKFTFYRWYRSGILYNKKLQGRDKVESMLSFYGNLSKTQLLFMFIAVTVALAAVIIGFNRKYGDK